ncbi:protein containing DUF1312 [Candidatus Thiomargarita nelsonii]|uniref:Protein containing DUF1312 n=1 Tax=Candidatus Thiomargarita nelsonii TaxID=1003181 RepID=A0A176S0T3_9GAMM|nr:protein containing DUF1312 [Candidatus Thiomargarita nelsonii]
MEIQSIGRVMTTVADRIILSIALLLLVWLYLHYWTGARAPADYALILVANQAPIKLDLQHSQQIAIAGSDGESLIEVADGRIRFIASSCQSKHCIHAGWLTKGGDFVACLPNQVSIELHNAETAHFDAIVY